MEKITIVGLGAWGKKISSIISASGCYEVEEISSRDLLEKNTLIYRPDNIVWVTSPPTYQKQISKLIKFKSIIFEKPFLSTHFEYEKWKSDIPQNSFVSLPWNYSQIWTENYPIFLSSQKINIEIQRFGPISRPYMSPISDWLPHDLGLINQISILQDIKILEEIKLDQNVGKLKLLLNSNLTITWEGGFSTEKIGSWKISSPDGEKYLDFIKMESVDNNYKSIPTKRKYTDNPVLTMLSQFTLIDSVSEMFKNFLFYERIFKPKSEALD